MTPRRGNAILFNFLPATPSSPSQTLEGLFELAQRPSRALDSPRVLLLELQRVKDTIKCAAVGAEVPGDTKKTAVANLDFAFVENALSYTDP